MGLRSRLKRLQEAVEEEHVSIKLRDGSIARFPREDFPGYVFDHESARWKRNARGEDPGPAHPLTEALREAEDLDMLVAQYGSIVAHFVGQDEKMRGELDEL
jgi:hypothetical protein